MWRTEKLGEKCEVITGNSIPDREKALYAEIDNGIPYVATKDIGFDGSINYGNGMNIPLNSEKKFKLSKENSTLVCAEGGSAGRKIAFSDKGCHFVNKLFSIHSLGELHPRFIYFYTLGEEFQGQFKNAMGGMIGGVSISAIKKFNISFPSLAEQEKIVKKLGKAFLEIDKMNKIYSEHKRNAECIYENAIDSIFKQYSNAEKPIGEYAEINYGYTAKASFEKGIYKYLRITDIQNGKVHWDKVPCCDIPKERVKKFLLNDGDIVFARTGTTGKSFLVSNPIDAVFASYLIRLSVDRKKLLPNYVMHYFQSADYWKQISEGITGTILGGFNATKLSKLRIPIIDLGKQKEISNKLSKIAEQTGKLTDIYKKQIEEYNSLKSAFLRQELQSEAT